MKDKFTLSPTAERELLDIWEYIAADSIDHADAFLKAVFDKCSLLGSHPEMGRERPELAEGVRSFPLKSYVVFYRPSAGGVEIIRVLHSSRDIEGAF